MHNAFPQRHWRRLRYAVPVHVLYPAADFADEVVMARSGDIEASRTTLSRDFTNQTRLDQVAQIVIGGSSRGAGIEAIYALKDLCGSGMSMMLQQEGHDAEALRCAPQTAIFESLPDSLRIHRSLDYV
jgi:hypothetical protein